MNRFRILIITLLLCVCGGLATPALGQQLAPLGQNGGILPFQSRLNLPLPGLIWVAAAAADSNAGFGYYSGSYYTLGSKFMVLQDPLYGRWMLESRVHIVDKNGNFFGNFGLERAYYLEPANADLGLGVWYDGDFDRPSNFGHNFNQVGVNAYIKTPYGDWRANGYIPVGTPNYVEVVGPFTGHHIVIPGLDTALQGFDSTFRLRTPSIGTVGGYVDLGGYAYQSDLVNPFGGFKMRAGLMTLNGLQIMGVFNHDSVFKSTGILQVMLKAGNVLPSPTSSGREYEPTPRNDHVVRFHRDRSIAINPVTGLPYNVIHVNNQAAGPGNGTFEDPYTTLAQAQAGSSANDVIFVASSPVVYPGGITLQNGQLLLGAGVDHSLAVPGGTFILQTAGMGPVPFLTNAAGPVVTLSTGSVPNTVSGFQLLASAGNDGVLAFGVPSGATLSDLTIIGAGGGAGSGIDIMNSGGTFNITNTVIQGFDGAAFNLVNGNANVNFSGTINNSVGSVLNIAGTSGGTATFNGAINDNGGTGIQLTNVGGNVNVAANTQILNTSAGADALHIMNGTGNYTFSNLGISNASGAGVLISGGNQNTSITLNGTGLQNSASYAVDIQGMTGGSVTFNAGGAINDVGGNGVLVNNNNSVISFNNTVGVNTSLGTAVTVTNNNTVNFANVNVLATDHTGFLATDNGNLNIGNGTITTVNGGGGGGTALSVSNGANGNVNINLAGVTANNTQVGQHGVFLQNLTGTTNLGVALLNVTGGGGGNALFANNAGTVGTSVGSAASGLNSATININNTRTNMVWNTLFSGASAAQGVNLNFLQAGSNFTVLGVTTITNSAANGIVMSNSDGNVTFNSVNINMTAAGQNGINLTNNASTARFNLSGGNSLIDMNAAAGSNGINIVNTSGTISGANIQNIDVTATGINVVANGGSTSTVSLNANTLNTNIGNNGITLNSSGAGSTINATMTNSILTVTANSLNATANAGGQVCLNASFNGNGAGGPPTGNFMLTSVGAGSVFNVTQLSAADLSAQNTGVGVSFGGPINFNAGACPLP